MCVRSRVSRDARPLRQQCWSKEEPVEDYSDLKSPETDDKEVVSVILRNEIVLTSLHYEICSYLQFSTRFYQHYR